MVAGAPGVNWTQIRDAATAAVTRGWPIVPGTYVQRDRWYGHPGATQLGPVSEDWHNDVITDPEQALRVWSGLPYGVLLVCGQGMDALEVPAALAAMLPDSGCDGLGAPVAVVFPPPRWLVFVTSGAALRPELAALDVRIRTAGEWVPLPPTALGPARARWRVPPSGDPTLPDSAQVQRTIVEALASHRSAAARSCPR